MARSYVDYTGDGVTTNFAVPFPYIHEDHVTVLVDGVETAFTWITSSTVQILPAPGDGAFIRIRRSSSPDERLVDYNVPGTLTEEDLDNDSLQAFYMAQEAIDIAESGLFTDEATGQFNISDRRLVNVADPEDDQDAATKAYGDANWGGAAAANAASSAAAAAAEADAAAASAALAANRVTEAEAARDAAEAAQAGAEAAKAQVEELLENPALTGTPTAPTPALDDNSTRIATTAFVNDRAGATVRQTALFGAVDSNGYANFLSGGAGRRVSLAASAVPLVLSYSNGIREFVEQIGADAADIIGSDLPANNTSFIYKNLGGAWGSCLIAPQYGYAFDRTQGALLNFEGADGSTTILDDFGNTWTAHGNAQLDTAQKKFGNSSLLLDGSGSYVQTTDIKSFGAGSWEVCLWFRANAAGASHCLFSMANTSTGFGVTLQLETATPRLRLYVSSNNASHDVINGAAGTTIISLNTQYRVRLMFDALAGEYRMFLSNNGAAETQEITPVSSTARACAGTQLRVGATASGINLWNGWIDAFRFLPCVTNPSAETPSVSAPSITDYPVHFFSIPEMKMYEVTGASASAGSNPTMTRRNRLFLGEADTGAASVSAVRTYALRGEYEGEAPIPTVNTAASFNANIGVPPERQSVQFFIKNVTPQLGYSTGMTTALHTIGNAAYVTGPHWIVTGRNTVEYKQGSVGPGHIISRVTGENSTIVATNWKLMVRAKRNW